MSHRDTSADKETSASTVGLHTNRRSLLKIAGASAVGTIGVGTVGPTSSGVATVSASSSSSEEYTLEFVEGNSEAGFNYPYYLYGPQISDDQERPLLVLPNNPADQSDELDDHKEVAKDLIEGIGTFFAWELSVPVLVPVFPWYEQESPGADHCVNALDAETMALNETDLERPDEQLLNMVADAKERLSSWHPVADQLLLHGYTLPGLFANRFAALHPDEVRSVTAGEISGTPILPKGEAGETTLEYPIGVANVAELIDSEFDSDAFEDVDHFIYMGEDSELDFLDVPDIWNEELAEDAREVYGDDLQTRMDYSEDVYEGAGVTAEFKTYPDVDSGGAQSAAHDDIIAHHRPYVGISAVDITERPAVGAESVSVSVVVDDDQDAEQFDLRAFSDDGTDLTATAGSVSRGEQVETEVTLTESLEAGDSVLVLLLEEGVEDPSAEIASDATFVDATHIEFYEQPSAGDDTVAVIGTIAEDLSGPQEIRISDSAEEELTADPVRVSTYGGPVELNTELNEGDEITAFIQPEGEFDPDAAHVTATTTVAEEEPEVTAAFTYSPESPAVGDEVTFDASDSEPEAEIEEYWWDFTGDESPDKVGQQITHTFEDPGEHEVALAVVDDQGGLLDATAETITVREGCFIATAACGTPDHDHVETLRAFRDTTLKGNYLGEQLVRLYYKTSPPIADWIAQSDRRRSLIRSAVVRPAARLTSICGLTDSSADESPSTE